MAITKNGSTYSQGAASVNSTTWTSGSFAIASGTNRVLVVSVMVSSTSALTVPSATGLKWGGSGGTALTKVGYQQDAPDYVEVSLWYLIAPTVQTSTLYLTSADTMDACAVVATVWDGAAQSTPFSGFAGNYASWAYDHDVTVSSATDSLVIDAIMTAHTIVCQQTQDALVYAGALNLGQSHKAGAASVVMNWIYDSCSHAIGAASLAPYVGGGGDHINIALAVGGS